MMKEKDIRAFPGSAYNPGMDLSDYFAGEFAAAMVSSIKCAQDYDRFCEIAGRRNLKVREWIAKEAYQQADALLEERKKR